LWPALAGSSYAMSGHFDAPEARDLTRRALLRRGGLLAAALAVPGAGEAVRAAASGDRP